MAVFTRVVGPPGALVVEVAMPVSQEVAAARSAVRALEQATSAVTAQYGDTVDTRRLRADVARLGQDLDLLCGNEPPGPPPPPVREVIADTSYVHSFWMDAEDEGLGRADHR